MRIVIYDTTLRDGTQGENISFSVTDKLDIAHKLDNIKIDYIEGGWPGSNPRDAEFFDRAKTDLSLEHARLVAFGSTRHAANKVEQDPNVKMLVDSETPVVCIFGKSWDLHTRNALRVSEEQNLEMIHSTVVYLKSLGREVVYDAEHFFDGYLSSRDFAFRTLEAAQQAGADSLVLCDTNGGTLTARLGEVVADVRKNFDGVLGIHTHNDSELAVANAIAAVELGATHVQGTINGYGERCGNCNLVATICNLELKLGHTTIGQDQVSEMHYVAKYVADVANLPLANGAAFVGKSAFAHKGGIHVSAVMRDPETYEHIKPEDVGNVRRVLVSDLSGRSNITFKLQEMGWEKQLSDDARKKLLERIKQMEFDGYELESADGSMELLVRQELAQDRNLFQLSSMEMKIDKSGRERSECEIKMKVSTPAGTHEAQVKASGPFDAMAAALRQCLSHDYPEVANIRLVDYKVRVLNPGKGTAAKVRVLINWADNKTNWTTVGVSDDVLEASWDALRDSVRLELLRLHQPLESATANRTQS